MKGKEKRNMSNREFEDGPLSIFTYVPNPQDPLDPGAEGWHSFTNGENPKQTDAEVLTLDFYFSK